MPIRNPPSRDELIDVISHLDGSSNIDTLLKLVLGNSLYNKYVASDASNTDKLSDTLEGIEQDGLEPVLFSELAYRAASTKFFNKIISAYPEAITNLAEIDEIIDTIPDNIAERANDESRLAGSKFSSNINDILATIFAHESISRLRLIAIDLIDYYTRVDYPSSADIADISNDITYLSKEIFDELDLLPSRSNQEFDSALLNTTMLLLKDAAHFGNFYGAFDSLIKANKALRDIYVLLDSKVSSRIRNLSIPSLAQYFGNYDTDEGVAIHSLRYPPLAKITLLKEWGKIEAELALLIALYATDELDRGLYDGWLSIKSRASWLASVTPNDDWRARLRQRFEDLEDSIAGRDRPDQAFKVHLRSVDLLILARLAEVSKMLRKDVSDLRPLAGKINGIAQ